MVREVYRTAGTESVMVRESDSMDSVLAQFAGRTGLRSIFVTDDEGRLVGVITRSDLLDWTKLRLGAVLTGALTQDRLMRLSQLVRAATARDAIHPGGPVVSVGPDADVGEALHEMLEADLTALPVVDGQGRILGDLTLSDVLRHVLDLDPGD